MSKGAKKWIKSGCRIPTLNQVRLYFSTHRFEIEEGDIFFYFHRSTFWRSQFGDRIGDWKLAAKRWMWNLEN
ncbi:hypothetical protein SAMN03080598_01194 [Algoriphagus boritolerans DSM 17298 = JCM 18970]|uniref:Uncharacterized protein n=1 Tax=Algoriphagus boritolerans DSM 17298 = JCM 18970 TaxID=1120964 RepID=A0A1H5UD87_9BACT|nr:hypothetical protein SAMN03080598_01194 [Algoriphagus boritolerans DSM 17298 = JCM 18970]